jgi:hypothetical protein
MRTLLWGLVICFGCGPNHKGTDGNGSNMGGPDACVGLQCQVVNCQAMGMPTTQIKGKVFAPNGTLPLFGINVYVPNSDPGPFTNALSCSQCTDTLPGSPVGKPTQTKEDGSFILDNMPSGSNIPLVITTGKWRRIINIPSVTQCSPNNMVPTVDTTLPKAGDDMTANTKMCGAGPCVDLPRIAVTVGRADSLECLMRRIGIADKEITNSAGTGHVHLYSTNGIGKFDGGFANGQGGASFTSATPFWGGTMGTNDTLGNYDIVILSCEGTQDPNTKPQAALNAMKKYADSCGRVFASHWHNIWIGGAFQSGGAQTPPVWNTIATWTANDSNPGPIDLIDEVNNPKGPNFATWMLDPQVMGSTTRDQIMLTGGTEHHTCTGLDNAKGERWTYAMAAPMQPQNFQFTTPNEQPPDQRGGKVVFSDMHVSGGPVGGTNSFPTSCGDPGTPAQMSPQEKALAFMFFDIASCVSNIP